MAKSIHSKHKIRMRNEKRKRYYARELNNLKKLATDREARKALGEYSNMKTADQIALERKQQKLEKEKAAETSEQNDVQMTDEAVVRVYDKNLKDQFGNYPSWMKKKQIRKMKKKNDRQNKKKNKKSKK